MVTGRGSISKHITIIPGGRPYLLQMGLLPLNGLINGVITFVRVLTPFITGRGPACKHIICCENSILIQISTHEVTNFQFFFM